MAARKGTRAAICAVMRNGEWFCFAELQAALPHVTGCSISNTIRHMREENLMDADALLGHRKMRYRLTGLKAAAIVPVFVRPADCPCLLAACWTRVVEVRDGV